MIRHSKRIWSQNKIKPQTGPVSLTLLPLFLKWANLSFGLGTSIVVGFSEKSIIEWQACYETSPLDQYCLQRYPCWFAGMKGLNKHGYERTYQIFSDCRRIHIRWNGLSKMLLERVIWILHYLFWNVYQHLGVDCGVNQLTILVSTYIVEDLYAQLYLARENLQ